MTPFRKWVSSNLPKKTNNPNPSPTGKIWFGLYWFGAGNRTRTCTLLAVEPKSTESTNSTMPANEEVENVKLKIESYCFADRTMLVSILGIANTLFQPFLSMRRALRPNFPLFIFNFQLKRLHSIIFKNFCQLASCLFVKYDEKVLDNVPRCK